MILSGVAWALCFGESEATPQHDGIMSSPAHLSTLAPSSFTVGAALNHGFARIRQAPCRAAWLFGWDGATALILILIGAYFVTSAQTGEARDIAGGLFLLAVFARRVVSEAAWLGFFTGEPEARPWAPFRVGGDEGRLLGAGFIAAATLLLVIALIAAPMAFVVEVLDPGIDLGWAPALTFFAGAVMLFPRFLIALASTIHLKRLAPLDDLAVSGRIWGRAAAAGAVIAATLLIAFLVAGGLFQIAGLAADYQSFGARIDVLYNWALTAPLSGVDWLVLAWTALGASAVWIMARGAAAHAALILAETEAATPPAVRDPVPAGV